MFFFALFADSFATFAVNNFLRQSQKA
jgi:hypothetical protein